VPGKDRQRQLARQKVQRQMHRRAEQARRQRMIRNIGVIAVVVVVVLAGIVYGAVKVNGTSTNTATSGASNSPSPAPAPTTAMCQYTRPASGGTASRKVNVPSITGIPKAGSAVVKLVTNRGTIGLTLSQSKAPCTTHNFVSLLQQKYFNNTPCHRLTTTGLYVLQCGDPTGKGTGGPGYVFPDEDLPIAGSGGSFTYPGGTVAMANSGKGTNGSQFFLVYKDSPLPPNYSIFGTISKAGLKVIDMVAKGGATGGSGDGKPRLATTIKRAVLVSGGQNDDTKASTSATPSTAPTVSSPATKNGSPAS